MKKSDGKMILVSTPKGQDYYFYKAMVLWAEYGANPQKIQKNLYDAIWIDEAPFEDLTWWTKDGQPMQLHEMETSHIQNSLEDIDEGKIRFRERFIVPMKKELARRKSELGEIVYGDVGKNPSNARTSEKAGRSKRRARQKRK